MRNGSEQKLEFVCKELIIFQEEKKKQNVIRKTFATTWTDLESVMLTEVRWERTRIV